MRPVWLVLAFFLFVAATTPNSLAHSELVLIPGSLKDQGSMGPTGKYRMCSPLVLGLNQWQADWITRLIRPSDDQKERLRVLAMDSAKITDLIAAACRQQPLSTSPEQLAMIEKRVSALSEALKIIRPSYQDFYLSLDGGQRKLIDGLGPKRRGWRW